MSHSLSELGLDSNCLSYVIDALDGVAEPTFVSPELCDSESRGG
jgi:hypothetical protein